MKESLWGYLIIILGLVIISILLLVQNLTTANEEDYYLGREVMRSAMTEAVDYGTYQLTDGKLVMSREKFVEIFLRRFAESVTPNKSYQIDFYQIYEYPPAATVRIRTTTGTTNVKDNAVNVDVDTLISAILVAGEGNNIRFQELNGNFNLDTFKDLVDKFEFGIDINDEYGSVSDYNKAYDVNGNDHIDLEDAAFIEYYLFGKYTLGDVNQDGNLDASDANYIKSHGSSASKLERLLADVDRNGVLNNTDSTKITNYLAGSLNTEFTENIQGDINGDHRINFADALLLYKHIKGNAYLTPSQQSLADLSNPKDGAVDANDLNILIRNIRTYYNSILK